MAHLPETRLSGIELDPARKDAHVSTISKPESPCIVRAIPTDEDLMVARYTYSVAFAIV
jgi:acetate kinase